MAYTFEYDPTGLVQANRILNESHTIENANGINAYMFVPHATPFYGESMVVVDANGNVLNKNIDYFLSYYWPDATDATGKEIYGAVTMALSHQAGDYKLTYQTIGGLYVDAPLNTIHDSLVNLNNSIITNWSNAPTGFEPSPHTHRLTSVNGMNEILSSVDNIATVLQNPPVGVSLDDIVDINPRFVQPTIQKLSDIAAALSGRTFDNGLLLDLLARVNAIDPINVNSFFNTLNNYVLKSDLTTGNVQHFRGVYTTLSLLTTSVTNPIVGDYAQVDSGNASTVLTYFFDATDGWVEAVRSGLKVNTTDNLSEGNSNFYFSDQRAILALKQTLLNYVPNTRTINDMTLNNDIHLTTADIPDSTNFRYLTDDLFSKLVNLSPNNSAAFYFETTITSTATGNVLTKLNTDHFAPYIVEIIDIITNINEKITYDIFFNRITGNVEYSLSNIHGFITSVITNIYTSGSEILIDITNNRPTAILVRIFQ